jgi:Zn finger protein HypA/HybF involved in hydrogenase expression
MPTYDEDYEDEYEEDEDEYLEDEEGILFACEDCDYRWKVSEEELEYGDYEMICPMCGSSNVVEI